MSMQFPKHGLEPVTPTAAPPEREGRPRAYVIAAFGEEDLRKVLPDAVEGATFIADGPADLASRFSIQQLDAAASNGLKVALIAAKSVEEAADRLWAYLDAVAVDCYTQMLKHYAELPAMDKIGSVRFSSAKRLEEPRLIRRVKVPDMVVNQNAYRKLAKQMKDILELVPYDRFVTDREMGDKLEAAGIKQKTRDGFAMWTYYCYQLRAKGYVEYETDVNQS